MITRMIRVYDLTLFVSERQGVWSWTVRTADESYEIPLGPAHTHNFVSMRGVEESELECIREGTKFAVQTARMRIQPVTRRRYTDDLVKIDLGKVVEEAA